MKKYVNINDQNKSLKIVYDPLPTLYKTATKIKINNKESDILPYKIKFNKNYISNIYKNFEKKFGEKKPESLVNLEKMIKNNLLSKNKKNIENTNNSLGKIIDSKINAGSMVLFDLKEYNNKTIDTNNIKQKYLSLSKNYVFTPMKDVVGNHFNKEKFHKGEIKRLNKILRRSSTLSSCSKFNLYDKYKKKGKKLKKLKLDFLNNDNKKLKGNYNKNSTRLNIINIDNINSRSDENDKNKDNINIAIIDNNNISIITEKNKQNNKPIDKLEDEFYLTNNINENLEKDIANKIESINNRIEKLNGNNKNNNDNNTTAENKNKTESKILKSSLSIDSEIATKDILNKNNSVNNNLKRKSSSLSRLLLTPAKKSNLGNSLMSKTSNNFIRRQLKEQKSFYSDNLNNELNKLDSQTNKCILELNAILKQNQINLKKKLKKDDIDYQKDLEIKKLIINFDNRTMLNKYLKRNDEIMKNKIQNGENINREKKLKILFNDAIIDMNKYNLGKRKMKIIINSLMVNLFESSIINSLSDDNRKNNNELFDIGKILNIFRSKKIVKKEKDDFNEIKQKTNKNLQLIKKLKYNIFLEKKKIDKNNDNFKISLNHHNHNLSNMNNNEQDLKNKMVYFSSRKDNRNNNKNE